MIMWSTPKLAVGPGAGDTRRRTGSMAHRKGLFTAQVGAVLVVSLLLAVLMTGRVVILNQMTAMRTRIAVLEDQKCFLETRSASLQAHWNKQTSAQVICDRAEKELDLINPQEPGLVLVKLPADPGKSRWGWPQWLEGFGGGDPAQAGENLSVRPDGKMVHLTPAGRNETKLRETVR